MHMMLESVLIIGCPLRRNPLYLKLRCIFLIESDFIILECFFVCGFALQLHYKLEGLFGELECLFVKQMVFVRQQKASSENTKSLVCIACTFLKMKAFCVSFPELCSSLLELQLWQRNENGMSNTSFVKTCTIQPLKFGHKIKTSMQLRCLN